MGQGEQLKQMLTVHRALIFFFFYKNIIETHSKVFEESMMYSNMEIIELPMKKILFVCNLDHKS